MMLVGAALVQGTQLLEDGEVPAARLTAEVLLAHAIGCDRVWLYAHSTDELTELWWIHYGRYLHERLQGKPTQYITRKQEFYGREFAVSPDVLIPRPETEHIVERALAHFAGGRVVDVGTGSGAIAVTLALELPEAVVAATELSPAAARMARRNAERLGARVSVVCCDLLSAVAESSVPMVVSNPPYVPRTDLHVLQREVVEYEPHMALFGGTDGFEIYTRLIEDAWRVLQPGGWLIMETAYNGHDRLHEMLSPRWNDVATHCDLAGLPRVIEARKAL